MTKFIIKTSPCLTGKVSIGGCKNAILPILAASLLTSECCKIYSVPALSDVIALCSILEDIGIDVAFDEKKRMYFSTSKKYCNIKNRLSEGKQNESFFFNYGSTFVPMS